MTFEQLNKQDREYIYGFVSKFLENNPEMEDKSFTGLQSPLLRGKNKTPMSFAGWVRQLCADDYYLAAKNHGAMHGKEMKWAKEFLEGDESIHFAEDIGDAYREVFWQLIPEDYVEDVLQPLLKPRNELPKNRHLYGL